MSASTAIRSLLLPMRKGVLVVPASVVEEVLFAEPLDLPPPAAPEWLLGEVQLRQQAVPLLSFETLTGDAAEATPATVHAVVIKNLDADSDPAFYAIRVASTPRVETLDTGTLQLAGDGQSDNPFIACRVIVEGEEGTLPDLDALVAVLQENFVGV